MPSILSEMLVVGCLDKQTFVVTQVNNTSFTVLWDNVVVVNLFIQFTATSINGTTAPNISGILAGLPSLFVPRYFKR